MDTTNQILLGNHLINQRQVTLGAILLFTIELQTPFDCKLFILFILTLVSLLVFLGEQFYALLAQSLGKVRICRCKLGVFNFLKSHLVHEMKQKLQLNSSAVCAVFAVKTDDFL